MTRNSNQDEIGPDAQHGGSASGGRQVGGGPVQSDMAAPGGSSGGGGYGNAQNQQNHQGQEMELTVSSPGQSRGERFDELSGGGRGPESVSGEDDRLDEPDEADAFLAEHGAEREQEGDPDRR